MDANAVTAFEILLTKYNSLVKENVLLTAKLFEVEDELAKLKKQDGKQEETA